MHGKFRLPSPGKMSSHSTALVIQVGFFFSLFSCVQCFCVSVIHQTLTWNDGYRIFNVRTWSFLILCMHNIHGGWAYQQRDSTTFWLRKMSQIFVVLRTGFGPLVFGWMVYHYWATPSPIYSRQPHIQGSYIAVWPRYSSFTTTMLVM